MSKTEEKVYNQVVYYASEGRGVRVASAWTWNEKENTMYGWYMGYEGGGCYGEYYFKAVFKKGNIKHMYTRWGEPTDGESWDTDMVSDEHEDLPNIILDEFEQCDNAFENISDDFLEYEEDSDTFKVPEKLFEKMEDHGDGDYIFVKIENEAQTKMFAQVQNHWQLLSWVTFED